MRYCASLFVLIAIVFSCSKDKNGTERTNFAELTVNDYKFVFTKLEAILDTGFGYIVCNFRFEDTASNSQMLWEVYTGGENRIKGTYKFPGELFPGRSIPFLHLGTYIGRVPYSYQPKENSVTATIDYAENGRIHGIFSGRMFCLSCDPYYLEVDLADGEFEMPYSYRQ